MTISSGQNRRKKRASGADEAYFKRSGKRKIFAWIIFVFFAIYAAALIYPFIWMLGNSLKTEQTYAVDYYSFPVEFYYQNYITALLTETSNKTNMLGMFFNSIVISTLSTALTVFFSSCAAYVVAKYRFTGRNLIYAVVIFSLIIPVVGTLPALLRMMRTIKIHNTIFSVLFIYSGAFGTNFLLLYSFFKNVSWGYAEAAQIDGAGNTRIFFSIMIPLALPAIASVSVLTWVGLWNENIIPKVMLPSMPTIAVGMYDIVSQLEETRNSNTEMFAMVIMALIPIIAVFSAFQKIIMKNTVAGGLKG